MHAVTFSAILRKIMSTFNHIIANRLFGTLKIAISCVQIIPLPPLDRWEARPICTHTRDPGISAMSIPAELSVITIIRRRATEACKTNIAQQPKNLEKNNSDTLLFDHCQLIFLMIILPLMSVVEGVVEGSSTIEYKYKIFLLE